MQSQRDDLTPVTRELIRTRRWAVVLALLAVAVAYAGYQLFGALVACGGGSGAAYAASCAAAPATEQPS